MDYEIVTALTRQGEEVLLMRYPNPVKFAGLSSASRAKSYRYTLGDGSPVEQLASGEIRTSGLGYLKLVEPGHG